MTHSSGRYHQEYKQNEIATSNQGKLILMMYEGAIRNLKLALECINSKDLGGKGIHISKAHDIINELSLALNMEKGGEVTHHLEQLYMFVLKQLTLANIKPTDQKPVKNALEILTTLQEAWQEVITKSFLSEESDPKSQSIPRKITAKC